MFLLQALLFFLLGTSVNAYHGQDARERQLKISSMKGHASTWYRIELPQYFQVGNMLSILNQFSMHLNVL